MKSKKQPVTNHAAAHHLRVGEYHKAFGGALAGLVRGAPGQPDYYLFVAPADKGDAKSLAFGPRAINVTDAISDLDGLANTRALCAHKESHPAAQWAAGLTIDGFSDYYLPARHELRMCYLNAPELFKKEWYWSSTQYAGHHLNAWTQYFDNGYQYNGNKDYEGHCRAVRRLIIQ